MSLNATFAATLLSLLAFMFASNLQMHAAETQAVQRLPTVAILDDGDITFAPLVEAKLLAAASATFVERNQIEQVLKEQKLQAAFDSAAVGKRSQLGRLLKCDLLVLMRQYRLGKSLPTGGETEVYECVVCETKNGLRLATKVIPKKGDADAKVQELYATVQQGLAKWQHGIKQVFAVPPLISDDLDFRRSYLQASHARLMQQHLLAIPGVVVVELLEAQAISKELSLTGENTPLSRQASPFFILGRYRHAENAGKQTIRFQLRLEQAGREIRSGDSPELESTEVANWLFRATNTLLKAAGNTETVKGNPEKEAAELAARAEEFSRAGNWEEALTLLEASLSIEPMQAKVRSEAVIASGKVYQEYRAHSVPLHEMTAQMRKLVSTYRRGMAHLEYCLQFHEATMTRPDGSCLAGCLGSWGFDIPEFAEPTTRELYQQVLAEYRESMIRIGIERATAKPTELFWFNWATARSPLPERLKIARRMLSELKGTPNYVKLVSDELASAVWEPAIWLTVNEPRLSAAPEFAKLMSELEASQVSEHLAIAKEVRQRIDANALERKQMGKGRIPVPTVDLTAEFQFEPITFRLEGGKTATGSPKRCVRTDAGVDVFCGGSHIFLMRKAPILKQIWEGPIGREKISEAVYDGKYVWFVVENPQAAASIIVIDPVTEQVRDFRPPAGLPVAVEGKSNFPGQVGTMKICPLGVGRVLVAAYMGRTWVGIAEIDNAGASRLSIVGEAKRDPNTAGDQDQSDQDVIFTPQAIFPYRETDVAGKSQREFLILRDSRPQPLIYSEADKQITLPTPHFKLDYTRSKTTYRGQFIGLQLREVLHPNKGLIGRLMHLVAFDSPGSANRILVEDVTDGQIIWHEDHFHIIGESWWVWNPKTSQARQFRGGVPWQTENTPPRAIHNAPSGERWQTGTMYGLAFERASSSQHLGIVIAAGNQNLVFKGIFPNLSE